MIFLYVIKILKFFTLKKVPYVVVGYNLNWNKLLLYMGIGHLEVWNNFIPLHFRLCQMDMTSKLPNSCELYISYFRLLNIP